VEYLARVYVTLKPTVNDPPGLTVRNALHSLAFDGVEGVRVGKYLELRLNVADEPTARAQIEEMCRRLLANPVIEEFRFDLSS
jgi:phosphoribosylformylglycinamidine synthase subunit PurS